MVNHSHPNALRYATAMLLLGYGFAFSQQPANASCGDYLQLEEPQTASFPVVVNTARLIGSVFPEPPRRRCHGPGCSQQPNVPEQHGTATPTSLDVKIFAALSIPTNFGKPLRYSVLAVLSGEPIRRSADIFRPPRPRSDRSSDSACSRIDLALFWAKASR